MKKIIYIISFALIIAAISLFSQPHTAAAQTAAQSLSFNLPNSISISLTPRFPEPNEEVTVTVTGNAFSVDNATIGWSKNGQLQKRGTGANTYTLQAGEAGSVDRVSVTLIRPDGEVITGAVPINPVEIDLVWEADSYTPPLYKGKALRAPQGKAKVVAFVNAYNLNGEKISNDDIFYRWEFNGRAIAEFSGYGNRVFPSDVSRNENTVTLRISTRNDELLGVEEVTIPNHNPEILMYRKKPLSGIQYNNAFTDTTTLENDEINIVAEPYFFDISQADINDFEYTWNAAGDTETGIGREISFNRNQTGITTEVSVDVFHPQRSLQRTKETININLRESQ